jgi:hypothetical protein
MDEKGLPLTAFTDSFEMWPDLLLKSLVANYTDLDNLRKASPKSILRTITGSPCIELDLSP